MPGVNAIQLLTADVGFGWSWTNGHLALLRTMDAGAHWTRVRVPTAAGTGGPPFEAPPELSFSDRRTGWLLANRTTWRTTDGGRRWSLTRAPWWLG
jgi:photosystem II stability/assembly factor-like uncharacterized protein